ncbi:MAG: RNA polymerase sigma factor [Microbacteriaceae bacterium]
MVLRVIADLTVEQIAVVLGKRPGAVKALQRRALDALRKKVSADRTPADPAGDSEEGDEKTPDFRRRRHGTAGGPRTCCASGACAARAVVG